jgi:hypothetical protein
MRQDYSAWCIIVVLLLAGTGSVIAAEADVTAEQNAKWVLDSQGQRPEPKVAITNVCAWPNLTRLPNGDIVALIYNQPSHGRMPGDVECWASQDEGETWTRRSVAAPRGTPEQNRMNVAAGLTAEGDLILVCSGWSAPGNPEAWSRIGHVLPTWVCISKEGGETWSIDKDSFPTGPDGRHLIPFGDIMPGADGKLRVAAYRGARGPADGDVPPLSADDELARRAASGQNWIVRGDGRSWDAPVPISEKLHGARHAFNETALLHLGDGKWLAAARYGSGSIFVTRSEDDAQTWMRHKRLKGGYPGHLLRLEDGTILLSRGNRGRPPRGVDVLFSEDEGRTWSEPYRVLAIEQSDLGYPSSVLRKDGLVVTAYYEGSRAGRYHMGVVVWDPVRTLKR